MRLCIIGTGYVGLVSAACFAEMGNLVYCVDNNQEIVAALKAGQVHIYEPGLEDLVRSNHAGGRLFFDTSLQKGLIGAEFAFICVGTPPNEDGSCDLSHVEEVAKNIGNYMQNPLIIVDKSTVPVGTADRVKEIIFEALHKRGADISFQVVSNPEFLKEGDAVNDFMKPDRIIVGTESDYAAKMLHELYSPFARSREKIMLMSTRSAEMSKYAANCMLAAKISFINEIAALCEKTGADAREVRQGIGADHRIGPHFIYPGLGYGGSCFPKDVKALIHSAKEVNMQMELLMAVESVNAKQKISMAVKILDYFAAKKGHTGKNEANEAFAGLTLAMWGLAFKANTDDMREAASLSIVRELSAKGVKIRAYDPQAAANAKKILATNPLFEVVADEYAACEGADALLVATEWNQFRNPDFARIKKALKNPAIFDGRNLYNPIRMKDLGFDYFCVGKKPQYR